MNAWSVRSAPTCAAVVLLSGAALASEPVGVAPASVRLTAARGCNERVLATDHRVFHTTDAGRSWRLIFETPAPSTPAARDTSPRHSVEVETSELLAGALGAGLLEADLRDLWYFGDGETGLDFLDASDDSSPLEPSDAPSGFPEAGEWRPLGDGSFGERGRRAGRLWRAAGRVNERRAEAGRITSLGLDADGAHVGTAEGACFRVDEFGAHTEACGAFVATETPRCPASPRGARARGPSLDALLAAADARFGSAYRLRAAGADAADRAAWVPRLAVVGGYASLDQSAILAAAFLDQPMPFSGVKTQGGYGFGDVGGTLADGQNITFQKDAQVRFPYVLAVLSWDLAGPRAPPPPALDDADALRGEVVRLWMRRAELTAPSQAADSGYGAALEAAEREEVEALLEALTGATLTDHDTPR